MTCRMKICCSLLSALIYFSLQAQQPSHFNVLRQSVAALPYLGKKIQLQGSLRMETADTATKALLWLRVDKPDRTAGFFRNSWYQPQPTDKWRNVVIEGFVTDDADSIVFGGAFVEFPATGAVTGARSVFLPVHLGNSSEPVSKLSFPTN